mmetsp:Transcript_9165/g.29722  ORF Transcript_9165/g.29722 Transcript_9165/m.29722 type:complete len:232 (+) Transcript_9165:182-877(+)
MGGDRLKEEGLTLALDWNKVGKVAKSGSGVVPVCVQDATTREVLILAYANDEALRLTIERKLCVLFSTSRKELWIKGDTSGDYLDLDQILVNCEQNSLLYLVVPRRRGACHTRDHDGRTRRSCYYRALVVLKDKDKKDQVKDDSRLEEKTRQRSKSQDEQTSKRSKSQGERSKSQVELAKHHRLAFLPPDYSPPPPPPAHDITAVETQRSLASALALCAAGFLLGVAVARR